MTNAEMAARLENMALTSEGRSSWERLGLQVAEYHAKNAESLRAGAKALLAMDTPDPRDARIAELEEQIAKAELNYFNSLKAREREDLELKRICGEYAQCSINYDAARTRIAELEAALATATEFDLGQLPNEPEYFTNRVLIQRREGNLLPKQPYMWAVKWNGNNLAKDGEWEYEPLPSSRDDDFYARCRFDTFEDAKSAAQAALKEAQ